MIQRLAVFLGSRDGGSADVVARTYSFGRDLAERGVELVYGGGGSGLMGHLSRGVLDGGGRIYGVIPRFMVEREWGRSRDDWPDGQIEMHIVTTMHERKAQMTERAQAFLALPGGLGTMEELFEVWTWRTLGLHHKPLGLLDVDGFWTPFTDLMDHLVSSGFMDAATVRALVVDDDLDRVLDGLDAQR